MCNPRLLLLIVFGLSFLHGCAQVYETQCRQGDWSDMGYRAGLKGNIYDNFESSLIGPSVVEACQTFGITADATAYRQGFRKGIETLSRPISGFDSAYDGHSDPGTKCPGDLAPAYRAAHEVGWAMLTDRHGVTAQEAVVNGLSAQIAQIRSDVAAAEATVISSTSEAKARYDALARIDTAPDAIRILERDLRTETVNSRPCASRMRKNTAAPGPAIYRRRRLLSVHAAAIPE